MRLSRDRLIKLAAACVLWLVVVFLFFFIYPSSWIIVVVFCLCVSAGVGLTLWVLTPFRLAVYAAFATEYLLFLTTEHIVRLDLILYGIAIIVLTELFLGRHLPMIQ